MMSRISKLVLPAVLIGVLSLLITDAHAENDYDLIRASCSTTLKLSDSGCDCIVAKTQAELNDNERGMLVASIQSDPAKIAAAQSKLSGDEMNNVMTFMTNTPSLCQNQ